MSAQSSQPDRWRKDPLICPNCGTGLKRVREPDCIYYACPCCGGRSSTIALMRRFMPKTLVNHIWQSVRQTHPPKVSDCPVCRSQMSRLPMPDTDFDLDVCQNCMLVWFDPGEYAALPKLTRLRKAQPVGLATDIKSEVLENKKPRPPKPQEEKTKWPTDYWKYIPALLGNPVEFDHQTLKCRPVCTWSIALVVFVLSLLSFLDLHTIALDLGLVPEELGRLSGFTFLTHFFIHGSFIHLFGNLYFLIIFGDNVEEYLGKARFLFFLLLATAGGGLLHVILSPDSTIPLVGASGGISGLMAYYALQFPKNRIGFFLIVRWLRVPVAGYIAFWILLQFLGLQNPDTDVAYGAHLGGALTGLLYWLFQKISRVRGHTTF